MSFNGIARPSPARPRGSKLPQYLWGMGWEWMLVGFHLARHAQAHNARARLIGGRWATSEDFLLDIIIAAVFWVVAALVLGGAAQS